MTLFIPNARHDRYYAVSEIVEIGAGKARPGGFGYTHKISLRDGGEEFLDGYEADQLIEHVTAVIPAQPGYWTIETGNYADSGAPYTTREPVICWQLIASGEMRPVTIRGPNNGALHSIAVQQPSGEVWMPIHDAIYPNFEAFREAELERQTEEEAERVKRLAERCAEQEHEQ